MKNKKIVIQKHHLVYERADKKQKEHTVLIRRNEHWLITQLNRLNPISEGLIKTLKLFITLNEDKAIKLKREKND